MNVIQSQRWPGAITVAKNGVFCSVYVGDLLKRGDNSFIPTEPPEVLADPAESELQAEPQGKEAVAKPEGEAEAAEEDQ